jgi:hypothetical protein
VARRRMEMPAVKKNGNESNEAVSTDTAFETGRYLLQVDKQTKGSFPTSEAAHSAGLKVKKSFPILQVAIYDNVSNSRTLVTLPIVSK